MLSASSSVCRSCRYSFLDSVLCKRGLHTSSVLQRQKPKKKSPQPFGGPPRYRSYDSPRLHDREGAFGSNKRSFNVQDRVQIKLDVRARLNAGVLRWSRSSTTLVRLKSMGVARDYAEQLLEAFVEDTPMKSGGWFPPEEDEKWQMQRIKDDARERLPDAIDRALTRRFMAWVLETSRTRRIVPSPVYAALASVQSAVDHTHPTEWYPTARMLRRKIHMHVGPTNSGKTHNALRALAASKRGVYASPLRLLAYEVFDRLNNGRIVPLGADPSASPETFKRACNLVTGEEVRTVDEDANLLSCTVEMIDTTKRYDVAVVDEIQMLSDPERGGAWTAAVLGLHAEEVHLCGEAGAVPLVQSMLADVGDELIVHRYERLTPLTVASESLKGDLKKIQKGDCVVSFSRNMLFRLKRQIEEETGMRCAIIYGRLPPEVRSEQAERFNDPNSGYDVLIGSDAIGMGLNLKIKRIVFESSQKWDGTVEKTLSLSQLKQIAGRAGRFGLHGDEDDPGGVVTTLREQDLPTVRKAVESHAVPISKRAILPTTQDMFHSLEQLIRPCSRSRSHSNFGTVFDILRSTARMAPSYTLCDLGKAGEDVVPLIDTFCKDFTLEERLRILMAPVQWRDAAVKMAAQRFLEMYRREMYVKLEEACEGLGILEALEQVHELRGTLLNNSDGSREGESEKDVRTNVSGTRAPAPRIDTLLKLESLYRVAVVYMWFNMRLPLAFPEREKAVKMKEEVESAIEWALQRIQAAKERGRGNEQGVREEEEEEEEGEWQVREEDVMLDDESIPEPEERLVDERENGFAHRHIGVGILNALHA